jgi:hypothetical protein
VTPADEEFGGQEARTESNVVEIKFNDYETDENLKVSQLELSTIARMNDAFLALNNASIALVKEAKSKTQKVQPNLTMSYGQA